MLKKTMAIICASYLFLTLTACGEKNRVLLERKDWNDEVKTAVNDLIKKYGNKGNYAVFDFDNTSSVFDVEEQLAVYQLQTMSFVIEPSELPEVLRTGLSDLDADRSAYGYSKGSYNDIIFDICAAYEVLWNTYGPFTPAGLDSEAQSLIRSDVYWQEFATKMRAMYNLVYDAETPAVAYPWVICWFKGMTKEEVYSLATASFQRYAPVETEKVTWTSPSEIESRSGVVSYTWTSGVQVTENIKELWHALSGSGIDVWVCSASCTDVICAAIDFFGMHDDCRGVLAMTNCIDAGGVYVNQYDFETGTGFLADPDGVWTPMDNPTKAQTQGAGKVLAMRNAICPRYDGSGPVAGFMDSTGDFNVCTEFDSLKLVVCINRANRKVTDGGGLIAELAVYQKDCLGYDLKKANAAGDTFYVLQGRDENGLRTFRNSRKTVLAGEAEEKLFANDENAAQLQYMIENKMSVKEIIERFSVKTGAGDSKLGFEYGFLEEYEGYHSK